MTMTEQRSLLARSGVTSIPVEYFESEMEMLVQFVALVRNRDPDMLVGEKLIIVSCNDVVIKTV